MKPPKTKHRRPKDSRPKGARKGKPQRDPGAAPRRIDRRHSAPGGTSGNPRERDRPASGRLWIYGRHAAAAALANPQRKIKRILASPSALDWLAGLSLSKERRASIAEAPNDEINRALHEGAVHQGIAVEVEDLPHARLREACGPADGRPVLVLDQITDPHNIGAIFRSAAAFGVRAIIVQDRRTPPLAGALAKAAAGAVETVPCAPVVNVARALEALKGLGYFCAGLAGEAEAPISALPAKIPIALVLGAEGAGLRHLVRETCDGLYSIPIASRVDSLNVSNAAAISLYEIVRGKADASAA